MSTQLDTDRPFRLGMIVPSSNTCLEPQSYRILGDRRDVTMHSSRIEVTRIELDEGSDDQFGVRTMQEAAELLATAKVDSIAWNGTSGSWLGIDHDRAIADAITAATGVPATTSTIALFDLFDRHGITDIALLTPYTDDVNELITSAYAKHGYEVTGAYGWALTDNESFARVPGDEVRRRSRELLAAGPGALVYLCTNLYGADSVEEMEAEFGIPVLDSVAFTLWHCLELAGAPLLDPKWGRLLA